MAATLFIISVFLSQQPKLTRMILFIEFLNKVISIQISGKNTFETVEWPVWVPGTVVIE